MNPNLTISGVIKFFKQTAGGLYLLVWLLMPAFAQAELSVIKVKNTLPELLLPSLEPMLDEGGKISFHDDKLLIDTNEQNLAMLSSLIKRLDTVPRQLRISVRQGPGDSANESPAVDNERSLFKSSRTIRAGSVGLDEERAVFALEGRRVYIGTVLLKPVLAAGMRSAGDKQNRSAVVFKQRAQEQGFWVQARVQGDKAFIDIELNDAGTTKENLLSSQRIQTSVLAGLGRWTDLGLVIDRSDAGVLGFEDRSASTAAQGTRIQLMVEIVEGADSR